MGVELSSATAEPWQRPQVGRRAERQCYHCLSRQCERRLHKIAMRSHHDMGGLPAGRVQATEQDYALWERRVDALMVLLSAAGRMTVDELRKNIEAIGPDAYDRMPPGRAPVSVAAPSAVPKARSG